MERIPGLDDWLTRGPDDDHVKGCQLHEDYECERCQDPECPCDDYCDHESHECTCDEVIKEAKADAAQAKIDAWKERGL